MEKKTRLPAPNFTNSDSLLLCDILCKYKHIIENKKTDGATLLQKQKAWQDIMEEYNAVHHRTVESLQQNYKNLKKKTKKSASDAKMDIPVDRENFIKNVEEYGTSSEGWEKVAEQAGTSKDNCKKLFNTLTKEAETKEKVFKKNIMGTGGGPPPKYDDDPLLTKVKGLVGPTIDGLYTIYDGDSSLMAVQNLCPIEINNGIIDNETCTSVSVETDEKQYIVMTPKSQDPQQDQSSYFTNNRANLKKKPHNLLSRKRKLEEDLAEKQSVSEKFKVLASEKLENINLQKEILKLQLMEEQAKLEHNNLLRNMEIEDAKAKYEHNEKLRKLELEKNKQA